MDGTFRRLWMELWSRCVCREGSVVAHFWLVMSVPSSHVGRVTLTKVTTTLQEGLRRYGEAKDEMTVNFDEYLLHLPTLSVSGERNRKDRRRNIVCVCVCV